MPGPVRLSACYTETAGHERILCEACGTEIRRCHCAGPYRQTRQGLCASCRLAARRTRIDERDPIDVQFLPTAVVIEQRIDELGATVSRIVLDHETARRLALTLATRLPGALLHAQEQIPWAPPPATRAGSDGMSTPGYPEVGR
jgi:hypothetical protein